MSIATFALSLGNYITACWHDVLSAGEFVAKEAPVVVAGATRIVDTLSPIASVAAAAVGQPGAAIAINGLHALADEANAAIQAADPSTHTTGVTMVITPQTVSALMTAWKDAEAWFGNLGVAITPIVPVPKP